VRGFRVVEVTKLGANSFKHLEKANIPFKIISVNPLTYEFKLTGRLKLFVKEGDIKTVIGSVLKLFGAYERTDYNIEVF
jgi:hypothetical protein